MRQKAAPHMVNIETFVPSQFSQNPFAPSQQQEQQWDDNPGGTQSTSTPINSRFSQPLFDTSDQLSPIAFDDSRVSGYISEEDQEQNRADQSIISGYQQQDENEEQYQDYSGRNRTVQSEISGYQPNENEEQYQSYVEGNYTQSFGERNHTAQSVISGYQSGGVDRFNSLHRVSSGRIQKKVKKRKPGTNVDREIKQLQSTTHNLLRLAPFSRLVKETITKMSGGKSFRVQGEAIQALMQACEAFLIQLFEASYMCTNHAKRVTLKADDMQLVRRILSAFGNTSF